MMSEFIKRGVLLTLIIASVSCQDGPATPTPFEGSVWPTHTTVNYFSRFHAFGVGPTSTYQLEEIERRAVELIVNAETSLDVALEYFGSTRIADALIEAKSRGVKVRVVGDVDRRDQDGFQSLEDSNSFHSTIVGLPNREAHDLNADVVYGDGPVSWQAVFGRELVIRTGEDNLMTHNFIIADRHRILNLTGGFPADGEELTQAGFIAASEDLAKDFSDMFDQLHGGVFSTRQTFYDDSVSADTNNRTSYPTEDSVIEVYFGPQERLVKEVIDRIYNAKSSVYIASMQFKNDEIARALRYKTGAGFDVKLVLAEPPSTPTDGLDGYRINPEIDGTWVIIDGQRSPLTRIMHPGSAMVMSMPLFEAVPYYFEDAGEEDPLPQQSDRFTDANMWVVQQNLVQPNSDYQYLVDSFDSLFERGTSP